MPEYEVARGGGRHHRGHEPPRGLPGPAGEAWALVDLAVTGWRVPYEALQERLRAAPGRSVCSAVARHP
jgi:hypothetical protein